MMQLYNTLHGEVESFEPQNNNEVTVYTCGPTVYSEPLIGNWVAYIRWDLLIRTLKLQSYTVDRVMNVTDVGHLVSDADEGEDKMEKGARREGVTAWDIASRYTDRFMTGMNELHLLPPDEAPKATDHIAEQIDLIEQLERKGHTYRIDDGIYFDTATFPRYSDFAHLDLHSLKTSGRIDTNTQKRHPSDFALWKFSPDDKRRDMEWDSPWGKGFPGWHIECSAMALKYLGETIDIHTGGIDHIPVHHTNEIAQSESVTNKPFARFWLHANFLLSNGSKISKSLGNGYSLDDLKERGYSALDFKMFVLQSHYRSESNFTWENLAAAQARLKHWKAIAVLRHQLPSFKNESSVREMVDLQSIIAEVTEALANDLNSPAALTILEKALDRYEQQTTESDELAHLVHYIDESLGLALAETTPDIDETAKQTIREREDARSQQDWVRSDTLRDHLAALHIGINDTPDGSRWYYL